MSVLVAQLRMLASIMSFLTLESDSGGGTEGHEGGESKEGKESSGGDSGGSGEESTFTAPKDQAELDRMIRRRLAAHAEKAKAEAKTEFEAEREAKEATEKDDVRKLLELEQAKVAKLEGELKQERQGSIRNKVAKAHKLPDEVAELLKGETEEELIAHAKRLAKYVAADASTDGDDEDGDDDTSKDDIENDAGARSSRRRANQKPVPQFRVQSTVKTVKMPGT